MGFLRKFKDKAKALKSEIIVLIIVYKDKRTPLLPKLLIGLTVGYLLSPIDLIPDFIPVLGLLDDLIIVPLLIRWSIKLIPKNLLAEARQKAQESSNVVKKSNWLFAIIILILWVSIIALLYFYFNSSKNEPK